METNPYLLVDKVFNYHRKQINFLEDYYSKKISYKIRIKLARKSETSFFSLSDRMIYISVNNLLTIIYRMPKLFYSLFYSLLLHEIGHALYTDNLPYSNITNILEDNRIEHQISLWNTRTKFELMRFIYQDLAFREHEQIKDKEELALALLRTIDNSLYVNALGTTPERKYIIEQIMLLNKTYKSKDYELRKEPNKISELVDLSTQVSDLLDKLIENWNEEKEQEQNGKGETEDQEQEPQNSDQAEEQETDSQEKADNDDTQESPTDKDQEEGESGQEEEDDKEQEDGQEEEEEKSDNKGTGSSEKEKSEKEEDGDETESPEKSSSVESGDSDSKSGKVAEKEKQMQDIKDELSKQLQKGADMETELDNGMGSLHNPTPDNSSYDKFKISAFTTARRTGIKGSRDITRHTGNAKQLSLKKYARKDFITNEKMFDKKSNELIRGGKSAKVLFYLDISGSMNGMRLDTAVTYLKSFYDQMNKYLEIRFMAFGAHTYEITRAELDYDFLSPLTEGSTRPQAVKVKRNEEIIFITDGGFGTILPTQYMRKAHFVLIDIPDYVKQERFSGMRNLYEVHTSDINTGLERATKHIRDLLKGGRR